MSAKKKKTLEAALQRVRRAYHERIVAELQDTQRTYGQIAESVGVSASLVYLLSRIHKLSRSRPEPEEMKVEKA